ncbi:MAG: redoxin domain-containing protein [Acidobacteriaceae bacterium]|nr:redoxin domain-containing protein [Acidobacteriaceae bacterium]
MKRLWLVLSLSTLVAALSLPAQEYKVGSPVSDFSLTTLEGSPTHFSDLKGPVTVVTFISVQCPVSNAYNERMNALYNDYSVKGVKFVFINANRTESSADVAAHARAHQFGFPVYKDESNVVADKFGATVTPEAYVIDSSGIIRYHGSIDDSQNMARVTTQRLRQALDAVLTGQPPQQAETKAFGCTIKRVQKT